MIDVELIAKAIQNNKIRQLLLGEDGYALVYPHFFDLVRTDINFVVVGLNEYLSKKEDSIRNELSHSIDDHLLQICNIPLGIYYATRYLDSYLSLLKKTNTTIYLKINIPELVKKLGLSIKKYSVALNSERLDNIPLLTLLQKEIEGVRMGNIIKEGINEKLVHKGIEKITF